MANSRIERQIIIGMIVSTDYLQNVYKIWDLQYIVARLAKTISTWCIDYYEQYAYAPGSDIEQIFYDKLAHDSIAKDDAEELEEDILPDLNDEYERVEKFNSQYLFDKTVEYFKERRLQIHTEQIKQLTEEGRPDEAEELAQSYTSTKLDEVQGLDLSSEEAMDRIDQAFNRELIQLIHYPGAIGDMWNEQLIRGGFVAFLGPEKRGKTFTLIELGLRAVRQKCNVAFLEVGDMMESQLLKRICIYLARRSDRERYCCKHLQPVGDCIYNQLDTCDRDDRNCDFGVFSNYNKKKLGEQFSFDLLKDAYKRYGDEYQPCDSHTCTERKGSVWLKQMPSKRVLETNDAKKHVKKFFTKYKRRFKLDCQPSSTVRVDDIKATLDAWERGDGFVPDVILVDYADLLVGNTKEFRHRQDEIWQGLRSLSQERHCLVLTATQADTESYKISRLSLSNFSEDKRKNAHVTAMYGLNQDPGGEEKRLGIMRINELVIREGEFANTNEVKILQNLRIGRPYLESYK